MYGRELPLSLSLSLSLPPTLSIPPTYTQTLTSITQKDAFQNSDNKAKIYLINPKTGVRMNNNYGTTQKGYNN